mmetsp:Transcript_32755/g.59874  ORF Transcript_32755/g.59874 Transcript_32755/m.59874 type:complete len:690 (-) Transcript_32755:151-2220(-)
MSGARSRPKILQMTSSLLTGDTEAQETVSAFAGFRKRRAKSDLNAPHTTMFKDAASAKSAALQRVCAVDPWLTLYSSDGLRGALIHSPLWMYASIALVLSNTLWIAIETDNPDIDRPAHWLLSVDSVFCFLFLIELTARISALTRWHYIFTDGWLMFDVVMGLLNVVEAWIMPHFGNGAYADGAGSLRALRVLRLSRIARTLMIFRLIPELALLIRSITQALRAVTAVMCLLVLYVFINALYFTNLARDTELEAVLFPDVITSMKTLIVRGTLLDSPMMVIDMLVRESASLTMLFTMFIFVTACLLLNMLVGVLVEVVSVSAAVEQEETLAHFVMDALTQCLSHIGHDSQQKVTRRMMERVVRQGVMNEVLRVLDISMSKTTLLDHIFETDGGVVETVSMSNVVMTLLQLRSTAPATVRDVLDARRVVLHRLAQIEAMLRDPVRFRRPVRKVRGPLLQTSRLSPASMSSARAGIASQTLHSTTPSETAVPTAEPTASISSKELISQEFDIIAQQLTELHEQVLLDLAPMQVGRTGIVPGIPHATSEDPVMSDPGKSPRPSWQSPKTRRGDFSLAFDAYASERVEVPGEPATRLRSGESAATRLQSGDSAASRRQSGESFASRRQSGETATSSTFDAAVQQLVDPWSEQTRHPARGLLPCVPPDKNPIGQSGVLSSEPNHPVDVIVHYCF